MRCFFKFHHAPFVILMGIVPAILFQAENLCCRGKETINLKDIKNAAVLPFHYEMQTDFSEDAGTIAAEAFSEGFGKKSKINIIDHETVAAYLKDNTINTRILSGDAIVKMAEDLKVDCIIVGGMPEYDESEKQDQLMDKRDFGAETTYTTMHYRELRVKFQIDFYNGKTGEKLYEFSDVFESQDSAKDPMMPASCEVLLERIAKKSGKKLGKQVKN